MTFVDENGIFESGPAEGDDLVHRLRRLAWPAVPADVRERCWAEFSNRLTGGPRATAEEHEPERARRNAGQRLDFTRRVPAGAVPRVAAAARLPQWAAGPPRGVSALVG